jgi:hypothetical protein
MTTKTAICLVLAALAPTSAVARTLEPPAEAPDSKRAVIIERMPPKGETFSSNTEGARFGVWGAQRNVGLGLLIGPLGGTASTPAVGSDDGEAAAALANLTKADLRSLLSSAQMSEGGAADAPPSVPHYQLLPAALIRLPEDEPAFSLRCLVHAYLVDNGEPTWHARYLVVVDDSYLKDSAAAINRAKDALPACLTEAYRLFAGHVDGRLRGSATHKVRFGLGNIVRTAVIESELPHRVIVADELGLMEYPRGALAD